MRDSETPSQETVRGGVICIGCGYELAGLPMEGGVVCPECGVPIEESLTGPLLRLEGVEWLERVARGLGMIRRAALVLGVVLVMFLLMVFSSVVMLPTTNSGAGDTRAEAIFYTALEWTSRALLALLVIGMLMRWWAEWLTSTPSNIHTPDGFNWRRWSRTGVIWFGSAFVIYWTAALPQAQSMNPASKALLLALFLFIVSGYWVHQRGVRHHITELDARCAGRRALPLVKPVSRAGVAARLALLALVCSLYWTRPDLGLFLTLAVFVFSFPVTRKGCRRVRQRVRAELDAAKLQAS